jgi:hypothetical protein
VSLSPSHPLRPYSERVKAVHGGKHAFLGLLGFLELDKQPGSICGEDMPAGLARSRLAQVQKRQAGYGLGLAMRAGDGEEIAVNGLSHGGKYSRFVAALQLRKAAEMLDF